MSENKLSSYRVTDLPQLTDLNNQDLFLITHSKDTGGYESQSIPFGRLMRAVKRRGFKEEIQVINDLNLNAARKSEVSAEAAARLQQDLSVASQARQYTDGELQKIHTHSNLSVLSSITSMNVSQWTNDAGYLTAHQSLSSCASKAELSDEVSARQQGDVESVATAKSYTDDQISKVHSHANLSVLSAITDRTVSQWQNDAGYLASGDFEMKYTAGDDVLQLSVGSKILSAKIEASGGGTTYEYVHTALSNDGYGLKTRIRIWED